LAPASGTGQTNSSRQLYHDGDFVSMFAMKHTPEQTASPLRQQAADALRRARKLPVGPDRNDLRQLAIGLLWLERRGLAEKAANRLMANLRDTLNPGGKDGTSQHAVDR
jgi:predicted Zn-dependent peptidase